MSSAEPSETKSADLGIVTGPVFDLSDDCTSLFISSATYEQILEWIDTHPDAWCELEHLSITDCSLDKLPSLPLNLERFDCSGNELTDLPELPNTLMEFECFNNRLTNLPLLHNGITYLDCGHNLLTSLPMLPDKLECLFCSHNQLKSLPHLPTNLLTLDYSFNFVTSLPELPKTIKYVDNKGNPLTGIPLGNVESKEREQKRKSKLLDYLNKLELLRRQYPHENFPHFTLDSDFDQVFRAYSLALCMLEDKKEAAVRKFRNLPETKKEITELWFNIGVAFGALETLRGKAKLLAMGAEAAGDDELAALLADPTPLVSSTDKNFAHAHTCLHLAGAGYANKFPEYKAP